MCHPRAFFFIADSLSCRETILCTDRGLTRALKGVRLIISARSIINEQASQRAKGQKVVKHIHKYKEVEEHRHRNIEKSG